MAVTRNLFTLPENGRAGIFMPRIMMAERKQYTSIMRRLIWPLRICITIARPLSPRKPTPPIMANRGCGGWGAGKGCALINHDCHYYVSWRVYVWIGGFVFYKKENCKCRFSCMVLLSASFYFLSDYLANQFWQFGKAQKALEGVWIQKILCSVHT